MLELYMNIRKRRTELGITQTELAAKIGYADKSVISRIEKGMVDISVTKIIEFAKALDTTACDLMGYDGVQSEQFSQKLSSEALDIARAYDNLNTENEKILVCNMLGIEKQKREPSDTEELLNA